MLPDKDSFSTGLIIGILVPIVGFAVLLGIFTGLEAMGFMSEVGFRPYFRERTTSIIAIAFNAMVMNSYQKKRYTDTMRGIVIPSFIYIITWLILFWNTIFT
jgi:hypothetical protein